MEEWVQGRRHRSWVKAAHVSYLADSAAFLSLDNYNQQKYFLDKSKPGVTRGRKAHGSF
jgi:hypothetical protein